MFLAVLCGWVVAKQGRAGAPMMGRMGGVQKVIVALRRIRHAKAFAAAED